MTVGPLPEVATSQEKSEAKLNLARRWFYTAAALCCCIALLAVLGYCLEVLAIPFGILVWTVIIVFCLRGIVEGFEKQGVPRSAGTAIAYVFMFVVIGAIILLMSSPAFGVSEQFTNLIQSIPGYIQQITDWVNDLYAQYADILNNEDLRKYANDALASVSTAAQDWLKSGANGVVAFGSGVANAVCVIGFALVVAFWILMELPQIGAEFKRLVGDKHAEDWEMLHITLTRILGGYIKATLLQCAIIGVGCLILFAVTGVSNFAALGVITGLMNIIPVVGPWIGGALAAFVGLMDSPVTALIAFIGTIVIQQFVYTFISPRLMADSVDVHPALNILALMAGSAVGGVTGGLTGSIFGMLVSIPLVAVARALFVYYFEKRTGREIVAEDGVFFKGTPSEGEGVDPFTDATSPHPGSTAKFAPITGAHEVTGKMKKVPEKGKRDNEKTGNEH